MISAALITQGFWYGFSIAGGFTAFYSAYKLVKSVVGKILTKTCDLIIRKYGAQINAYLVRARDTKLFFRKLGAEIIKGLMRLYGKYGLKMSDKEMADIAGSAVPA
jgi:hypothetical protein